MNTYAQHPITYTTGTPFDPTELVDLARMQWPNLPELASALDACRWVWPLEGYLRMLHPREMEWSRVAVVLLEHPADGTLLVELVRNASSGPGQFRIGGVDKLDHSVQGEVTYLTDLEEEHDEDTYSTNPEHFPSTTLRIVR